MKPIVTFVALLFAVPAVAQDPAYKIHDWSRPQPAVVEPGGSSTQELPGKPPSDATVLFDGKDLSQWASMDGTAPKWIVKEGVMECVRGSGYIRTLRNFGDCQLHIEFATPVPPQGESQGRGNSGVFLMGLYEIQVLDSFQNRTYADGSASAVYGQYPPLVNASRAPGKWQWYDIAFTRPRFDDKGALVSPARVTVFHNGVLVQHNVAIKGPTNWMTNAPYRAHPDKLPLSLQDHGNPVRYRNVWVRELGDMQKEYTFSTAVLDRYVGSYARDPETTIVVTRKGDYLTMKLVDPRREHEHTLFPESMISFFARDVDSKLSFQTDEHGAVQGVTFYIGGATSQAKKIR